jgi:hypothetical protein
MKWSKDSFESGKRHFRLLPWTDAVSFAARRLHVERSSIFCASDQIQNAPTLEMGVVSIGLEFSDTLWDNLS